VEYASAVDQLVLSLLKLIWLTPLPASLADNVKVTLELGILVSPLLITMLQFVGGPLSTVNVEDGPAAGALP